MKTVVFIGSALRLYNEDPRPSDIEFREFLEMPDELLKRDGKKLGC
jgi:hypothetical protein